MSSRLVLLVIAALIAIGLLGQLGDFDSKTPRYTPARPDAPRPQTPRAPTPEARPPEPSPPSRRPLPDGARPLPPPSATDPAVDISVPAGRQSSTGTAFSLDSRGLWMTARHVADGCDRIFVLTSAREGLRVRNAYIHPGADIAILRTDRGAPYVALSRTEPRQAQTGYHFGYPKGEPGAVLSTLIGRATLRARGRYSTNEPVLVWAERTRVPDGEEHLGGISGGPAFNTAGEIIGVTVAGSIRRGRVFTADMSSVRTALTRANAVPAADSGAVRPAFTPANWVDLGTQLRRRLTIAKVVCLVES